MKKAKDKNRKAVKALHLLSIGEILICFGLLVQLSFLTEWFNTAALAALVGLILMLIGVIRLRKINFYFKISFFAILIILLAGIGFGLTNYFCAGNEQVLNVISIIEDIFSKGISIVYTFGILRGCALAATGKSKSKFGTHMLMVNTGGKATAFILNMIVTLFLKNNPTAGGVLSIIATIVSIIVELYFCVFLFRVHRKAKGMLEAN